MKLTFTFSNTCWHWVPPPLGKMHEITKSTPAVTVQANQSRSCRGFLWRRNWQCWNQCSCLIQSQSLNWHKQKETIHRTRHVHKNYHSSLFKWNVLRLNTSAQPKKRKEDFDPWVWLFHKWVNSLREIVTLVWNAAHWPPEVFFINTKTF